MTQALSYAAPVTTLSLLTAPSGSVVLGQPATVPFAVKVLQGRWGHSGRWRSRDFYRNHRRSPVRCLLERPPARLHTDANGIASTFVTPETSGAITLAGCRRRWHGGRLVHCDHPKSEPRPRCRQRSMSRPARPLRGRRSSASLTILASTAGVLVDWRTISGPIAASPGQSQVSARELPRLWRRSVRLRRARRPFSPAAPGPAYAPPSPRRASIRRTCVWLW